MPADSRFRRLLPPLFFGTLALAATWKALLLGQVFYFRDLLSHHVPHLALGGRMWRAGDIPLWSPLFDAGQPHLANPQNLALHPLQILYVLLPADRAFALSLFFLFALAGWGMHACARSFGATREGALMAGAAYQCSGFILSLGNLANLLATAAPLPLTFLFAARAARRLASPGGGRAERLAILGNLSRASICFALQILGGEPFVAALSLAGVALLLLFAAPGASPGAASGAPPGDAGWGEALRRLRVAAAVTCGVAGLSALLCAVVLIPAAAFYPETVRAWGFRPQGALQWSLRPLHLIEMVIPGFFGNPLSGTSDGFWGAALFDRGRPFILGIGVAAAALTAAAAAAGGAFTPAAGPGRSAGDERTLMRGLVWVSAAFTLLAFGRHALMRLEWLEGVRSLPLLRYPVRFLLVPTFALCLLSAFGIEALAAGPRRRRWGRLCLGACGALALAAGVAGAVAAAGTVPAGMGSTLVAALARASLVWGVFSLILLAPERPGWSGPRRAAALAALAALDPLSAYPGLNPSGPASLLLRPPEVVERLRRDPDRFRIWRDNSPRLEGLPRHDAPFLAETVWFRDTLHPSYGMEFDLAYALNTSGDESDSQRTFLLGRRLAAAPAAARARVLGISGVKYLLAFSPAADPAFEQVETIALEGPDLHLWRNRRWMPTARLVERAFHAPDPDAALDRLLSLGHDPASEVILETPPGAPPPSGAAAAASRSAPSCEGTSDVAIELERPSYLRICVRAPNDGYLVLADRHADGWTAMADGTPVPILRAEYLFRAVPVSRGEHVIEFRYRPRSLWGGLLASVAGAAIVGALLIADRRARRRLAGAGGMC